jgi:hypothetical protein
VFKHRDNANKGNNVMNTVTFAIETDISNITVIEEMMDGMQFDVRYKNGKVEVTVFIKDMNMTHSILSDMGII